MIFEGLPNAPSTAHASWWCAQRCPLLRRSCDGVAAATELRRLLRRAHSARRVSSSPRDAQNEASIHFPRVDLNFNGRGP